MSEAPLQTEAIAKSGVRFSIRTLLLAMVVVAIVAGTLGPHFRSLSQADQRFVGTLWITVCCGLAVLLARNAWKRIRLEKSAGELLVTVTPRGKWKRKIRPWQSVIGGGFSALLGMYFLVIVSIFPNEPDLPGAVLAGAVSVWLMASGISAILWRRDIQIRERGLVHGLWLLRWSHVTRCRWGDEAVLPTRYPRDKNCLLIEGVDQRHEDCLLQLYVEDEQLPRVKGMLRAWVPRRARLWSDLDADDADLAIRGTYIPINDRSEVTSRGVGRAIVAAVVVLVAFSFVVRFVPRLTFANGMFTGAFVIVLIRFLRSRRIGEAGPPLVRLRTRVGWPMIAGLLVLAVVMTNIESELVLPSRAFSFGLGLGCGVCFALIFVALMHEQLDLCENGVVLRRFGYWPWSGVRMAQWDYDGNGRLVLWCGANRVVTHVSSMERSVVEEVLRANLPEEKLATRQV